MSLDNYRSFYFMQKIICLSTIHLNSYLIWKPKENHSRKVAIYEHSVARKWPEWHGLALYYISTVWWIFRMRENYFAAWLWKRNQIDEKYSNFCKISKLRHTMCIHKEPFHYSFKNCQNGKVICRLAKERSANIMKLVADQCGIWYIIESKFENEVEIKFVIKITITK